MRMLARSYYFNNGKLDLSTLDEALEDVSDSQPKVYIDQEINNIFMEMGNCFDFDEEDDMN